MATGSDENPYSPPPYRAPSDSASANLAEPTNPHRKRSRTPPEHQRLIKLCVFVFLFSAVLFALSISYLPLLFLL